MVCTIQFLPGSPTSQRQVFPGSLITKGNSNLLTCPNLSWTFTLLAYVQIISNFLSSPLPSWASLGPTLSLQQATSMPSSFNLHEDHVHHTLPQFFTLGFEFCWWPHHHPGITGHTSLVRNLLSLTCHSPLPGPSVPPLHPLHPESAHHRPLLTFILSP